MDNEKDLQPMYPNLMATSVWNHDPSFTMWPNMEGSSLDSVLGFPHQSSNEFETDKVENVGGSEETLSLANNGKSLLMENLATPPRSLDYSYSSLKGVVIGGSSKNGNKEKKSSKTSYGEDSDIDPQRLKRILSNRISQQRSRDKKHQYITELQRKVYMLEEKRRLLADQVNIYENKRRVQNAEINVLKQQIITLKHELMYKDVRTMALQQEIEKLHQIIQFNEQQMQQQHMMVQSEPDQTQNLDATFDPSDFLN